MGLDILLANVPSPYWKRAINMCEWRLWFGGDREKLFEFIHSREYLKG